MGLISIDYDKWNHSDFLWAIEIKKYLINPLLELMINASTDSSFIKQLVEKALAERDGESHSDDCISDEIQHHESRSITKLHKKLHKVQYGKQYKLL